MNKDRADFVERAVGWLIDSSPNDDEIRDAARARMTLDGLYSGKSRRIYRLIKIAYLRGARRGASAVWEGMQPIVPRESIGPCPGREQSDG
jgi:hypothetical protein